MYGKYQLNDATYLSRHASHSFVDSRDGATQVTRGVAVGGGLLQLKYEILKLEIG